MFLSELNDLQPWGAHVGNAYIQVLTKEKLYIVAGPEFEELQQHVLVMYKAIYGTRSGGACWHDKLFDILQQMDFKPPKADPDIWMRSSKDGTHYEYIAVYVDDLAICMKDPQAICDTLKEKYKLKLKRIQPFSHHLVVDIPEIKMEVLLQIQQSMLTRFLSPMRKCLVRSQEDQDTTSSTRSPRN